MLGIAPDGRRGRTVELTQLRITQSCTTGWDVSFPIPRLHRIAHREFLRTLRSQTAPASLVEVAEVAEPRTAELTEAVELREVIRKLPIAEGEIVVLHYLQGYNCQEIARIIGAPVAEGGS